MVRKHFENTIQQLKTDKDRQLALVRERVTREIIIPHHNEIKQSRDNAIAELNQKLQNDIRKLQEQFAIERQALIDVGEKNMEDFANNTIATETALVAAQYDEAIKNLEALISKIKE